MLAPASARPLDLWIARGLTFGAVVLAFPVAAIAVFALGFDRHATADVLSLVYSIGLFAGVTTSLWPLPGLRAWSRARRLESLCLAFMMMSYATHLTWELGWLALHDLILQSRDAAWAYPWWAYFDGGDARYTNPTPTLLTMELLSVANGLVGVTGLTLWWRARPRVDRRGVLLCMATAVVHLYSTTLYFGGELLAGLPSVNTANPLDLWIKFGLANAPWLVFPWFVLRWGVDSLSSDAAPSG